MRFSSLFILVAVLLLTCSPQLITAQESLTKRLQSESLTAIAKEARQKGDLNRGALAFYQPTMNCAKCHEPANGRRLGPDLTEKRKVKIEHLVESILNPSKQIKEGYETSILQMIDGRLISGIKVEENDTHVLIDGIEQVGDPLKVLKEDIDESKTSPKSTMPEDLANQLSNRQQFLDLIAYLAEIADQGPGRATELKPASAMFVQAPLPEYESRVDHAGLIRDWNNLAYDRGEEIYRLRCASCHGTLEEEGSMPTSLRFASGQFKHGNDPFTMYRTLTHGYGMMNPQRWMVPKQKYAVIYYIRKHFLEPHNPTQVFDIKESYLADLPKGDTFGPKPVLPKPWTQMDYGPSWFNTIEVSKDGTNITQKGITIRLDAGPGGVESGKYWMMYDEDTLAFSAAWSDKFIDYHGIHFDGQHGRHPKLNGQLHIKNPVGPGWANPETNSFVDQRVEGRDGKQYGPLDRNWAQYKGMYRFGNLSILDYSVNGVQVLESPSVDFADTHPVFLRTLNIAPHEQDLIMQVAQGEPSLTAELFDGVVQMLPAQSKNSQAIDTDSIELSGEQYAQAEAKGMNWNDNSFTIVANIKTQQDGTILALTQDQTDWMANGQTLFLRGGRLTFDIGWVGAVRSNKKVNDGKWHQIAMSWNAETNRASFYVDGKPGGGGNIAAQEPLDNPVVRIGFTNFNFPGKSFFQGELKNVRFYQRLLAPSELASNQLGKQKLLAHWNEVRAGLVQDISGKNRNAKLLGDGESGADTAGLIASVSADQTNPTLFVDNNNVRLRIPPSKDPVQITLRMAKPRDSDHATGLREQMMNSKGLGDLTRYTHGGPSLYPEILETETIMGDEDGPFAVDVFRRPTNNPWFAQLRLTGVDFDPTGNIAVVSTWDGSVFKVTGLNGKTTRWKRIASGLFQPLGIKWIGDKIFVTCRDQLCLLRDLNGDEEADYYECYNNDHQVTEHFHEFAMGLQTDEEGSFYYAKSARHALKAVVPHHGTLLKISADGEQTEIVANGFRAANGVCINPDGSFVVTDQEGHWNPKNRINWVQPGGFYGNMFGYHDVTDDSDDAMDQPLCWITNSFDRSPAELMWVESPKWGELDGKLLNFSYGYGKVYIVPHEKIGDQMQGGMCAFALPQFPTGVMRGRFNPVDGQLYCCGMFAWSSSQQQPGGFYRIRRTEKPVHLPIGLIAKEDSLRIEFSGELDRESALNPDNWAIKSWDLKRTKNYGSQHYNTKRLQVSKVALSQDGKTVELTLPDLKPTWCMEINYAIKTSEGKKLENKIHNTIHQLGSAN